MTTIDDDRAQTGHAPGAFEPGMSYRNDVDALAARTDALAAELKAKSKELDSARTLLDQAKARAKLPVLPNLRVASPCSADWNAMSGDERVRACGACNKNVYNVSELTREEAEALILAKEGRLCVRYFQRKDGTILLKDCSIGITQKRKRRLIAAGVAALLGSSVFAAIVLPTSTREGGLFGLAKHDVPEVLGQMPVPVMGRAMEMKGDVGEEVGVMAPEHAPPHAIAPEAK